ncbi:MAG: SDR family NAD(P)-dependent oxidoreductase [Thalassovita sp.]|nr:SDR family NAD(P)-dependent oxidoreductase [Thalassovita sp.]
MHVIITGANRGIGHQLYSNYRDQGHEVTGTARSGGAYLPLDVTKPDQFAGLAQAMDGKPVDLLICNAGVYLDKGQSLAGGYPPEMWAETFATNVTGVFLTIQSLLPNLQMTDGARVAIISSQMASQTNAPGGSYIYRASKAAVLNLGRNLAADLKGLDISIGIYHPGWVQTDMGGNAADITVEEAADGLMERFSELGPDSTGCFLTWDGRKHVF